MFFCCFFVRQLPNFSSKVFFSSVWKVLRCVLFFKCLGTEFHAFKQEYSNCNLAYSVLGWGIKNFGGLLRILVKISQTGDRTILFDTFHIKEAFLYLICSASGRIL